MPVDLNKLSQLAEKATGGIWEVCNGTDVFLDDDFDASHQIADLNVKGSEINATVQRGNAEFVTALVNNWPEIYKELEAGRKLVEELTNRFEANDPREFWDETEMYTFASNKTDGALAKYRKAMEV